MPTLNCVLHYETDVSEMKLQRIISTVKDCILAGAIVIMSDLFFGIRWRRGFIKSTVKRSFKVKLSKGQMFGEEGGLILCAIM